MRALMFHKVTGVAWSSSCTWVVTWEWGASSGKARHRRKHGVRWVEQKVRPWRLYLASVRNCDRPCSVPGSCWNTQESLVRLCKWPHVSISDSISEWPTGLWTSGLQVPGCKSYFLLGNDMSCRLQRLQRWIPQGRDHYLPGQRLYAGLSWLVVVGWKEGPSTVCPCGTIPCWCDGRKWKLRHAWSKSLFSCPGLDLLSVPPFPFFFPI